MRLKLILVILSLWPLSAQTNLLTVHNNLARLGQNAFETKLTTTNVNSVTFGKLFQAALDGVVDAEPLYVGGIPIPGQGTHNLLIVATENDSLYALDADTGAEIWKTALVPAGETASADGGCTQVVPQIGITSTPAIEFKTGSTEGAVLAVAMSKDAFGEYHHRLYKVNLTGGKTLASVEIAAKYPGTGIESNGTVDIFNPAQYKERSGLLLLNGVVYLSWASHCDRLPFTGWIMGYDANTLAETTVLNITPNGEAGAMWGSGAGFAADANGFIYAGAGNGTFDTALNAEGFPMKADFGNAFLQALYGKQPASGGGLFLPCTTRTANPMEIATWVRAA